MAGETVAHFDEQQVVQFGWMMNYAKGRKENKCKEVIQDQIAQSFKYKIIEFWS